MITVFGGTGFLGRVIASRLASAGERVRVAARRPEPAPSGTEPFPADVRNEASVAAALEGARGAVNAVALYVEGLGNRFQDVHVHGAERIARLSREQGPRSLVHVSGIGSDPASRSPYIAARGQGEEAVRTAFPDSVILRPSVLFGPGGAFLRNLDAVTRLPAVPLFGSGGTRLQPVFVEDVAEAVVQALERADVADGAYDLGGAEVLTYREIVELVLAHRGRGRPLVPVPFPVWRTLATAASVLPRPPLTNDQIALLETDNVAGPDARTFADLGLIPSGLRERLAECLPPTRA